jgi:predicted component of type VI protein secretion system
MQKKVGLMEKKLLIMDDFDPEDLERKVKKLTKSVKSIREELEE